MRVQVLKPFNDTQLGRKVMRDEILEVSEERGVELITHPSRIAKKIDELKAVSEPIAQPESVEPKNYDTTPPLKSQDSFDSPTLVNEIDVEDKPVTPRRRRNYKGAKGKS